MRFRQNPLIDPSNIKPTRDDFEVVCALNPAVTEYNGEILLLMRIAERPYQEKGYISTPVLDTENSRVKIARFKLNDPLLTNIESRTFRYNGRIYLTTMSHLRIARSTDGINFTIDEQPLVFPESRDEEYGVEDARITHIDGKYLIYYVAVSHYGISTVLAETTDFMKIQRKGIIFPGVNKDVAIFPEKIGGKYYALTRPDTSDFAKPSVWIANSPDLLNWGGHKHLISPRQNYWDSGRIGAGTVPLRTEKGWLEIYHGADINHRYSLGLMLLDSDDPSKVLFRSEKPLMKPTEEYETNGFFSEVIFTSGMIAWKDKFYLYYGAADKYICGASVILDDLLSACE